MENKPAMTKPVKIQITDELDLHSFRPEEVTDLLEEYFTECIKKRLYKTRKTKGNTQEVLLNAINCLFELLKTTP